MNAKRIATRIVIAVREGPDATDRDFFSPPAPRPAMTMERFREITVEVLRDRAAPFSAEMKLGYIKSKGAELGLEVDDRWLANILNEVEVEFVKRVSGPNVAI